jgi:transcription elongation factor/antiterminator RfaH
MRLTTAGPTAQTGSALCRAPVPAPVSAPEGDADRAPDGAWYAVHCASRREEYAAANLRHQNFRVFLPCHRKTRRHARKLETVRAPFFPGYLFVQFDAARDRWRAINGTYGVLRLVGSGDAPSIVPERIIAALQNECDAEGVLSRKQSFTAGQKLRVVAGPFADLIGTLERLDESGRVRVLLDFMGGRVPAFLPEDYVAAA